jgi:hypothetical protein
MKYPSLTPSIMSRMINNLHQSGDSTTVETVTSPSRKEDVLSFIFNQQLKEMKTYLRKFNL